MRFMVIVKATRQSEAGELPKKEVLEAMHHFNEELIAAGIMQSAEGLLSSAKGARVRVSAGKVSVLDGPFAETKELIAGYWIWKVKSKDEAIAWARRVPNPTGEDYELELRQVGEAEDFGPELHAQLPEVFEAERKFRGEAT